MAASWDFILTDLEGNQLSSIVQYNSAQVQYVEGAPATVAFVLPVTADAVQHLLIAKTLVIGYRTNRDGVRTLRFTGHVIMDEIQGSAQGGTTVSVLAADPRWLFKRWLVTGSLSSGKPGTIIQDEVWEVQGGTDPDDDNVLIRTYNNNGYLGEHDEGGVTRTDNWIFKMVGEIVDTYYNLPDYVATDFIPIYPEPHTNNIGTGTAWTLGDLSTSVNPGVDRPDAELGFGAGTLDNVISVSHNRNVDRVARKVWVKSNRFLGSALYTGYWPTSPEISISDVDSWETYDEVDTEDEAYDIAEGILAKRRTPDDSAETKIQLGVNAPEFFDDFYLSDTLPFTFKKEVEFTASLKVYGVTLDIKPNGNEVISALDTRQS